MTQNKLKHPCQESKYWNDQGIRHLSGENKLKDVKRAEYCFRCAIKYGDDIASLNLALLIKYGLIEDTDNEFDKIMSMIILKNLLDYETIGNLYATDSQENKVKKFTDACERFEKQGVLNLMTDGDLETKIYIGHAVTLRTKLESKLRSKILRSKKTVTADDLQGVMAGTLVYMALNDYGVITKSQSEVLFKITEFVGKIHNRLPDPDSKILTDWEEYVEKL